MYDKLVQKFEANDGQ